MRAVPPLPLSPCPSCPPVPLSPTPSIPSCPPSLLSPLSPCPSCHPVPPIPLPTLSTSPPCPPVRQSNSAPHISTQRCSPSVSPPQVAQQNAAHLLQLTAQFCRQTVPRFNSKERHRKSACYVTWCTVCCLVGLDPYCHRIGSPLPSKYSKLTALGTVCETVCRRRTDSLLLACKCNYWCEQFAVDWT